MSSGYPPPLLPEQEEQGWGIGGIQKSSGSPALLIAPSLSQCPAADRGQRTTCLQL